MPPSRYALRRAWPKLGKFQKSEGRGPRRDKKMKLGIVYHMPFWRGADGRLYELEGSFARYVDSLAPYFDEVSLAVPVLESPAGEGTPIRARNVTLAPPPPFDCPVHF